MPPTPRTIAIPVTFTRPPQPREGILGRNPLVMSVNGHRTEFCAATFAEHATLKIPTGPKIHYFLLHFTERPARTATFRLFSMFDWLACRNGVHLAVRRGRRWEIHRTVWGLRFLLSPMFYPDTDRIYVDIEWEPITRRRFNRLSGIPNEETVLRCEH